MGCEPFEYVNNAYIWRESRKIIYTRKIYDCWISYQAYTSEEREINTNYLIFLISLHKMLYDVYFDT